MMHRLVPQFIIEQYQQDNSSGTLYGTVMFVDVTGFSTLTSTLMRHGQHGAEVLATIMRAVFDPLVQSVYRHGGFLVGFAGDAFTAVFPDPLDPLHPLAAAWEMQQHRQAHPSYQTAYGTFNVTAKVGMASGELAWGIYTSAEAERATYFFKGAPVDLCSQAEHHATQGEIIMHNTFSRHIAAGVTQQALGNGFGGLTAVSTPLPAPLPISLPDVDSASARRFFPSQIITQTISGEFRQVINLFINLPDQVSAAQLDSFMQSVFTLQQRYGGLLNRIDFGDKGCHLLFFWGAPTSYENDIVRSLNFLLALRDSSQIELRAGLSYHVAHAGFIGSSLHEEYTCYGRGVNLAARLMTNADWGTIWTDAQIAERARNAFRFEFVMERPFKGFEQPLPIYQLLGQRQRSQQTFYENDLIGREAELAQLAQFVQPLLNGRFAGVLAVTGEAGMGKSRLLHEFFEQTELLETADLCLCQSDEIIRQSLNPLRYWLRDYFNQDATLPEADNKRSFDQVLDTLIAATAVADLASELERTRSFLGALIDLRWPDSLYEEVEPQRRFDNTLAGLKALLKADSLRQPILLFLEDAQWVDEDTWTFLQRLTRNIDGYPIAVFITSRRRLPTNIIDPEVNQETIELGGLSETAVSDLVQNILNITPTTPFLKWLNQRSDGTPYFIEQLLLYLKNNGLEPEAVFKTGTLLPDDVRSLLIARLDSLPLHIKDMVQTAAVLGREFDKPVLLEMTRAASVIDDNLQVAVNEGVWTMISLVRYLFRHSLMRDAAYDMQVHTRLHQLHHQAATAMESVYSGDLSPHYSQIAYHYDQAQTAVKALPYYERAAERAQENYQNEEALTHYNRALALTKPSNIVGRSRLLLGKEAVLNWRGQRSEQENLLQEVETLLTNSDNAALKAELTMRQAQLFHSTGRYEAALDRAQRAADMAHTDQNSVKEIEAIHLQGRTFWSRGDYQQARPFFNQSLQLAQAHNHLSGVAKSLYDLSVIDYYQSNLQEARQNLQHSLNAYRQFSDREGEISCLSLSGILLNRLGEYSAAERAYQEALELCRSVGWRVGEAYVLAQMGNTSFELGLYPKATLFHQQALEIHSETGSRQGKAGSLDTLGLAHYYEGNYETAVDFLQEAERLHESIGNSRGLGYALTHLGYAFTALHKFEAAEAALTAALAIRRQSNQKGLAADTVAGLIQLRLLQQADDLAQNLLTDLLAATGYESLPEMEFPLLVTTICYKAFMKMGENTPRQTKETAVSLLNSGHQLLQEQANRIKDPALRQHFLQNVPYNRDFLHLWQQRDTAEL